MKAQILTHLNNPTQLEKLYRQDKSGFKHAFNSIYPEIKDPMLAAYWNERLNYVSEESLWGTRNDLVVAIILAIVAGTIAKFPAFFSLNEDFFYQRNIGFIVFPALTIYFAWRNKLAIAKIGFFAVLMIAALVFINLLPDAKQSDTLILSCAHLILFLWSILGISYVGGIQNDSDKRLGFLKYNGDLVVMTTLILIAGAIMSGITIGLFSLIGFNIAEKYMQNVGVFGLAAAPIIGTYLTQVNPQLVGKVSPVIAKIFSPLVLVMLVVYIGAIVYAGKDPYNNREFLLIFNGLLVGVMAIIFFSIAGTPAAARSRAEIVMLLALSLVTIVVNSIALSAIVFRISEWGLTPNRAAVLGSNILILINLLLVTVHLFKVIAKKSELAAVAKSIGWYLPVYAIWTIIVTFLFPFLFGFK